ncbi:UDP-N-acetylglucosamine--N-acetylmuramyl-(pentapeptide) pyrophosphoryl-undecaprenol N-acetylglucosamine transferase-like [Phoenix dactylifera]|uniref:UDP-N-acetylglucosamine--N-acetylmuramyl- (Pentapeptide) pyrophosphoryl-undecaprenol N-acetylglucosamine transferase-like n=1 Tax=Phoenix dactylifera TaxID=42345 RepID=A0A8B7CYB6_PHODC|nr:UDP-N-acetylglucosamine--N-acetylmuramyl-(pentapeptide) pyrophosphoryl-undecaprenol N-acetylglucosamine transferase-like [Phoenix dactylifera]
MAHLQLPEATPMAATAGSPPLPFSKFPKYHSLLRPKRVRRTVEAAARGGDAPDLRVIFAGGGSGGHIYPALAIADELRSARPGIRIVFLGTGTGMERDLVPAAGHEFLPVPKARLARPFLSPQNLLLPLALLRSIFSSWNLLRSLRPHLVVGTGAYVCAPVCFAAALAGLKLVIQEQNCYPGITNRALAPYAEKIFLAFNACLKYFPTEKCIVAGNPIRLSIGHGASKAKARSHFFPEAGDGRAQVVLVLGGSTGANALNVVFLETYYKMLVEHEDWYIIWQTGAELYDETKTLVKNHSRLLLAPFLDAMDLAYAASDVVVSRAGAMTCTEILTTGKPSILIPSPTSAEDHQTKNAYMMADLAGSKVLTEEELDSNLLEDTINEVLGDESLMAEMSEKAMRAARPNASSDIAKCILSLVEHSSAYLEENSSK